MSSKTVVSVYQECCRQSEASEATTRFRSVYETVCLVTGCVSSR